MRFSPVPFYRALRWALLSLLICSCIYAELATDVVLEQTISGLGEITGIENAGDDRLFVINQAGKIQVVEMDENGNASVRATPFLDISENVVNSGERGLLGLAFHPNYINNGYFFVYYTCRGSEAPCSGNDRDSIVARYTRSSSNPNVADPASRLYIAVLSQPYSNHNGGDLVFHNGMLIIGTGDGGGGNDPDRNSLNLASPLGKILRVNVDNMDETMTITSSNPRWNIPPDNPFVNDPSCEFENDAISHAIWAYGLRNPWRFSFDRQTGDLWIADVGQVNQEEVNFIPSEALVGGENYGWGVYEGNRNNEDDYAGNIGDLSSSSFTKGCSTLSTCQDISCLVFPVLTYPRNMGVSVTGGYVYRGLEYASELNGTYFYADFGSGTLWGARPDDQGGWTNEIIVRNAIDNPTTFGENINGEVYVGTLGGELFRIKPRVTATPPPTLPLQTPPPVSPTKSPTPGPTLDVRCPLEYDNMVSLAPALNMSYAVRVPEDSAAATRYGGILCAQLVYESIGWVAFGISINGQMIGSEAIIGRLIAPASPTNPGKYVMTTKSPSGISPMQNQTLINATIEQDTSSRTTILTFTKILKEPGEIEIVAQGPNTFLYAVGQENAFGYHGPDRGSFELDFSGCNNNGVCDLGEDCDSCRNDCDCYPDLVFCCSFDLMTCYSNEQCNENQVACEESCLGTWIEPNEMICRPPGAECTDDPFGCCPPAMCIGNVVKKCYSTG